MSCGLRYERATVIAMAVEISQRELWKSSTEIFRRVAAGESFTVTRNGEPIADLTPHVEAPIARVTIAQARARFRQQPVVNVDQWLCDHRDAEEYFDAEGVATDPWDAGQCESHTPTNSCFGIDRC